MKNGKFKLILGSQSPRRKELLKATFLLFDIVVSNIDEYSEHKDPQEMVEDIASQKAKAVLSELSISHPLVIGADTIVVFEGEVLGKPRGRAEAKEMLKKLSGQSHDVYTGVSIVTNEKELCFSEKTEVRFQEISDDLLDLYLDTGDSLDKAGAYGIQGSALGFIESVKGSYSNVVGLPVDRVILKLKQFIGASEDQTGEWRENFE